MTVKRWHVWIAIPLALVDRVERWFGRDTERALRLTAAAALMGMILLAAAEIR